MVGVFLAHGAPGTLVDAIYRKGTKDLVIITTDMAWPDKAHGQLVADGRVRKVIASHLGTNPAVLPQILAAALEVGSGRRLGAPSPTPNCISHHMGPLERA